MKQNQNQARGERTSAGKQSQLKVESIESSNRNPLLELENAHAQADALLFLLSELVSYTDDGLTLHSQTKLGITILKANAASDLQSAFAGMNQWVRELQAKGGAK